MRKNATLLLLLIYACQLHAQNDSQEVSVQACIAKPSSILLGQMKILSFDFTSPASIDIADSFTLAISDPFICDGEELTTKIEPTTVGALDYILIKFKTKKDGKDVDINIGDVLKSITFRYNQAGNPKSNTFDGSSDEIKRFLTRPSLHLKLQFLSGLVKDKSNVEMLIEYSKAVPNSDKNSVKTAVASALFRWSAFFKETMTVLNAPSSALTKKSNVDNITTFVSPSDTLSLQYFRQSSPVKLKELDIKRAVLMNPVDGKELTGSEVDVTTNYDDYTSLKIPAHVLKSPLYDHADPIAINITYENGVTEAYYFKVRKHGEWYGEYGLWVPVGLFSINRKSTWKNTIVSALPVNLAFGGIYHPSESKFYLGASLFGSYSIPGPTNEEAAPLQIQGWSGGLIFDISDIILVGVVFGNSESKVGSPFIGFGPLLSTFINWAGKSVAK